MADPVVSITNGVPTSGTGIITTLGQTLLDGANATIGAKADAKAATTDATPISAMSVWKQISASIQAAAASLAGILVVKQRQIDASFSTITRPANVTPYTALDSISDNATAGSVSPIVATVSDVNDDPVCITELLIDTNDTGLAAGVQVRAFMYRSDPTANSGVGAGDNTAFSNKRAGFVGSFSGIFRPFSDGGMARLVPDEGSYVITKPAAGTVSLWLQMQTLGSFTPSANSTTIVPRAKGFQGRA